jgi:hypothetical protein
MNKDDTPYVPTRQARLKAHLMAYGPTMTQPGRRLNVRKSRARQLCLTDRARTRALEIMTEACIPAEFWAGLAKRETVTAAKII